jgi:hypothetical protein
MRRLQLLVLLGLLSLSIFFHPIITYAGSYYVSITGSTWGSQQSPTVVEPGTLNNLYTIYLPNFDQTPAQNITATLNVSYPFSSSTKSKNVSNNMSMLPSTAVLASMFYLNIASNSSIGVYTLPVNVKYWQSGSNYTFDATVSLPITTLASLTVQGVYWESVSK